MKKRKVNENPVKREIIVSISILVLMTACGKEPSNRESVSEILERQNYIQVSMGEAYHQEKVWFDIGGEKAVVPDDARWGRQKFRDGMEAGIFYGEEEGGERYRTDIETTPELYMESYMASIRNLDLKADDIKKENYRIRIVKQSQLRPFAEELINMSNIVVKNNYRLTGVEIEFDKKFRPVRKIYRLQETDENGLKREENIGECMQEFSYHLGNARFERVFKKVREEIVGDK